MSSPAPASEEAPAPEDSSERPPPEEPPPEEPPPEKPPLEKPPSEELAKKPAPEKPPVTFAQKSRAIVLFAASGTALTLVNKVIAVKFPYTHVVLLLQCGVTVPLVWFASWCLPDMGKVDPLEASKARRWIWLVLLFAGMLESSFAALKYVTVAALIVVRSVSALAVAIAEFLVLGKKTTPSEFACLIVVFIGTIIYGMADLRFSKRGYQWLSANIIFTGTYQVWVKKLVGEIGLTSMGMSYYSNVMSLPIFMAVVVWQEAEAVEKLIQLDHGTLLVLALSTVLGMVLSVSAFLLNQTISATSQMVVNNANKFVLIFISAIWAQDMNTKAALATSTVMGASIAYSVLRSNRPKASAPAADSEAGSAASGSSNTSQCPMRRMLVVFACMLAVLVSGVAAVYSREDFAGDWLSSLDLHDMVPSSGTFLAGNWSGPSDMMSAARTVVQASGSD